MGKPMSPEKYIRAMYGEKFFVTYECISEETIFELMEAYAQHVKDKLCSNAVQKIQEIWK